MNNKTKKITQKYLKSNLVIFDCDGVLVDTEMVFHQVGAKEMSKIGFPLTVEKSIEYFSGVSEDNFPLVVKEKYGRDILRNDHLLIQQKVQDSFRTDLKPISGITQVMDYLEARSIKKCIASNSCYSHLATVLALTYMDRYFSADRIFNVSMVKKAKPMPDIFLHAAKQLGENTADCVVIEDSIVGIQAAKAANMPVIGFLGGSHAKNPWYRNQVIASRPDMIASDALELLSMLRKG